MTAHLHLFSELEEFLRAASYGEWLEVGPVSDAEPGRIFRIAGDPEILVDFDGERYLVSKEERGARSHPFFVTNDTDAVEKYLSFLAGPSVRSKVGLSRITFDLEPDLPLGRVLMYEVNEEADGVRMTWSPPGSETGYIVLSVADAKRFLAYAEFTPREIRSSFRELSGAPLFTTALRCMPRSEGCVLTWDRRRDSS